MEEYTQVSDDRKLELRLGPPGDQFFGHKSMMMMATSHGAKRVLEYTIEAINGESNWFADADSEKQLCKKISAFEKGFSSSPWLKKNGSLQSFSSCRETQKEFQHTKPSYDLQYSNKEEACPTTTTATTTPATASLPSDKRAAAAAAPVIGWPPVRSFRKNLGSSSTSKLASKLQPTPTLEEENIRKPPASSTNDLFVKINVEGVPIGRKINLNAYDSYEKLSVAIDELFRDLIAGGCSEAESGEFTLIYEDNEGDRMLVGDVPWHMFVSTVKRLRVLKSFELPTPRPKIGGNEQEKRHHLVV